MQFFKPSLQHLRPLILLFVLLMLIFQISRLGLMAWQYERFDIRQTIGILIGGFRVDLSSAAYLSTPLLLLCLSQLLSGTGIKRYVQKTVVIYSGLVLLTIVTLEAITPAFITQYDVRPNRLLVEYLVYPDEVASMLLKGHLATVFLVLIIGISAIYLFTRFSSHFRLENWGGRKSILCTSMLVISLVLLMAARGSIGHRPLNPSLVYFSQDPLANSLTLNSSYSVAFAIKNMKSEKSASNFYGDLPDEEVFRLVRQSSYRQRFVDDKIPTLASNPPYTRHTHKNLVIVLEESLGARFVEELGGTGITPEFDKLYQQGWGFNNLYATGTRSVRGIEAVTTGFLPSPSRAVVKLSKSQQGFFTLADVLQRQGYQTQFVYGGESHFDNMKSFFLGNGFQKIVDLDDMQNPAFIASWGASDEDLFEQADRELMALHHAQQPFFSLIFTSSNHDPFDIPAGKVKIDENMDKHNLKRDMAIKYADYALGKFIANAKRQPYWQDTVFLVVADHDVRVFGFEPVPIKSFHVPAVILNSDFDQTRDNRLVSQIDLPVTLLSLIGIDVPTPMTGLDLTKQYPVQRALMQYYDNFAYLEGSQAVVLSPGNKASYWHYDVNSHRQSPRIPDGSDELLRKKALAHVLFSSISYRDKLYRLAKP